MWFADIGQGLSWALLAGWLLAVGLTVAVSRRGGAALDRVLPAAVRLPVTLGAGLAAGLVAVQAGLVDTVADSTGAGVFDQSVLSWFVAHRSGVATAVMTAVSTVGGTVGMAALAVLGASMLWLTRRRAEAGVVLVATAGAGVLVTGFKHLYDRARPPVVDRLLVETNAALPSGHALGSTVVLGVLAAVVVIIARRTAVQAAAVAVAVAGIVTIGVSRLYLGVHWTTDVLTGWTLGGAWLALCVTALVLIRHRRRGGTRAQGGSSSPTGAQPEHDPCTHDRRRGRGPLGSGFSASPTIVGSYLT